MMGSAVIETPSSDRTEPGSFSIPVANLPIGSMSKPTDPDRIASEWVDLFNRNISNQTKAGISDLFLAESYWRDQMCLSWDFHTLHGPEKIDLQLQKSPVNHRIKSLALDKSTQLRYPRTSVLGDASIVEAFLTVETDVGRGAGLMRLAQDHGAWKIFTLFTVLQELKGWEEQIGKRRPFGVQLGEYTTRKNWLDRRNAEENYEDGDEPTVLVLGKPSADNLCLPE